LTGLVHGLCADGNTNMPKEEEVKKQTLESEPVGSLDVTVVVWLSDT